MKLILLIFIFNFSIFADSDDIKNPYNDKTYSSFMFYEMIKDILKLKETNEISGDFDKIFRDINEKNPNLNLEQERFTNSIVNSSSHLIFTKNKNLLNETIDYLQKKTPAGDTDLDRWQKEQIDTKLNILRVGNDLSQLSSLSSTERDEYLSAVNTILSPKERIEIAKTSYISDDERLELVASLVSIILNDKDNQENNYIRDYIVYNNNNLTQLACNYIKLSMYLITEESDGGTKSGMERAREDDYFEPYMEEEYKDNINELSNIYSTFNSFGVSNDSTCDDGTPLKNLIEDDGYFDFSEIEKNLEINPVQNNKCQSIPIEFNTKELFSSCDIASVIWMLEKVESKKLQKNVKYINSKGEGNCNITLQSELKNNTIITLLRVTNTNGYESEVTSSPRTLINLLMK